MTGLVRHGWLVVVLVGAAVWSRSLDNAFQYDDFHSIVDNLDVRRLPSGEPWTRVVADLFSDPATFSVDADKGMYRPLLVLTFTLNHAAGGYDVTGYHVVSIAVHVACAAALWWLAGLLGAGGWVRLGAGLLFVVHPVASEPVNYISSRSESLAALFYLLGLGLFLRAESGRDWFRLGAWTALGAGLLTKSTTITLPAALLLLDGTVVLRGDWRRLGWRRLVTHHLPGWGVTAAYLVVVTTNGWLTRSLGQQVRGAWAQALTQVKALGYYLHLLAVPTRLSVDPQFAVQEGVTATVVAAGLLGLSLAAVLGWALRRRRWSAALLMAWPVLYLLPTFAVPLNILVNERRAYLPAAVICLALAWLPGSAWRTRTGRLLGAAALVVLGTLSWQRSGVWHDAMTLWADAVAKGPRMSRSHLYLGNAHKDAAQHAVDPAAARRHWRAASAAYERAFAEARDPDLALRSLNNRGGVHMSLAVLGRGVQGRRDFAQAEALFRQAVARNPVFADALVNLGSCVLTRARQASDGGQRRVLLEESIDYFRRGLRSRPNHPQGHANLGVAFEDLGRLDEAESEYRRALFLTPGDWQTLKNLASLLYRRALLTSTVDRRRLQEAGQLAQQALQLNPATPGARQILRAVQAHLEASGGGGEGR